MMGLFQIMEMNKKAGDHERAVKFRIVESGRIFPTPVKKQKGENEDGEFKDHKVRPLDERNPDIN